MPASLLGRPDSAIGRRASFNYAREAGRFQAVGQMKGRERAGIMTAALSRFARI